MFRFWREPLVHFLLIGAALFVLYAWLNPAENEQDPRTIVVDQDRLLTHLQYRARAFEPERFREVLASMPPEDLEELTRDYIREEALYREARSMQLDKNDYVARLRLIQQLEFLFRGFIDASDQLSEAEIEAYWQANRDDYREPANVTFTHVFYSNRRGDGEAASQAREQLEKLNSERIPFEGSVSHGDRFLYHTNYVERSRDMVASHFGHEMASEVFALEPSADTWHGPIRSPHGYHLVLLTRHHTERTPALEALRTQVARDAREARLKEKMDELMEAVVDDYQVDMVGFEDRLDSGRGS